MKRHARVTKKITPVLMRCPAQKDKVDRLVEHCRKLDGTELHVINAADDRIVKPHSREAAEAGHNGFMQAARAFAGRPFFWLETDSIPTQAGWLAACTKDYYKSGKHFMLAQECSVKNLVTAIGIWGPLTSEIVPPAHTNIGWDLWVPKQLDHMCYYSPLIQNRYCAVHDANNVTLRDNEFPMDKSALRSDAMIFHKDKGQTLLDCFSADPYILNFPVAKKKTAGVRFRHGGDIGDLIASLPILRAQGGGDVVLFYDKDAPPNACPRESLKGRRYEAIKPLLEVQPYINSVTWDETVSVLGERFREVKRPRFESLLERQARHIGMWPIDETPWLTIPETVVPHKRVVCCRSPRYHNAARFPWKEASETYGDRLLFIGLKEEHEAFELVVGRRVEWAKTENFLDIANIMAGAPMVLANQSSPLWVALGLGVKVVVEGYMQAPNTQVPRPGSFWAYTDADNAKVRRAFESVNRKHEARAIS